MVNISLEGITKEFETPSGTELAVDNLNFTINHGEFFTFVGPSGCGKTTTLRMIAGLETPTKGDIFFDDERVTDLPPQQRDIAMVFQNVTLYNHMTIYENIGYGLRVRKEMDGYDEKIRETAEILEITDMLDKKPNQLSGGQQQRVSLGRALVRDPNAILLDEPLSDLDAKLKARLRVVIQRIHNEFDTTIVYVTHDQLEALTMSDRIALMNNGRPEQIADPETMHNSPANEFVGKFIGQPAMNVVDAHVSSDGQVFAGGNADQERRVGIDVSNQLKANGLSSLSDVRLGFRPEHAVLTSELDDCLLAAEVDVWEPIGTSYVVYLIDEFGNELKVLTSSAPDVNEVGIKRLSQLYLFDAGTGEKIVEQRNEDTESVDSVYT